MQNHRSGEMENFENKSVEGKMIKSNTRTEKHLGDLFSLGVLGDYSLFITHSALISASSASLRLICIGISLSLCLSS
jgi:hypothetical protein